LGLLYSMTSMVPSIIAMKYQLKGPTAPVCLASAASACAIGESYLKIKDGYADVMLTGGCDYNMHKHFAKGMLK